MRPVGTGEVLPTGYKRVEYLESTGTQYIDTHFVPDNESGAYVVAQATTTTDYDVCAAKNVELDLRWMVVRPRYYPPDPTLLDIGYGWDDWFKLPFPEGEWGSVYRSELNWLNSRSVIFAAQSDRNTTSAALGDIPQSIGYSAYLFAFNNSGQMSNNGGCRIYEVSVSQGSEIVHTFVPCLDPNGKPCMFCTVSRKPFYNAATTGPDFLYG